MANPRIDDLRKRMEREPGSRLFAQLAEELRKDGNLLEAIQVCRDGLRKHPGYSSARLTLGRCLVDSGDRRGAVAELSAVWSASPDNLLAGRLLAESQEALGELAQAVATYRELLRLAPADKLLKERLAHVEEQAGRSSASASHREGAGADIGMVPIPLVAVDDEAFELERPIEAGGFAAARAPAALAVAAAQSPSPESAPTEEVFEFDSNDDGPPSGEPVFRPLAAGPGSSDEAPLSASMPATVPGLMLTEVAGPALASATLAELYHQQGDTGRAVETYSELLRRQPGNTRARERRAELQASLRVHVAPSRREVILRTIARLEQLRGAMVNRG